MKNGPKMLKFGANSSEIDPIEANGPVLEESFFSKGLNYSIKIISQLQNNLSLKLKHAVYLQAFYGMFILGDPYHMLNFVCLSYLQLFQDPHIIL